MPIHFDNLPAWAQEEITGAGSGIVMRSVANGQLYVRNGEAFFNGQRVVRDGSPMEAEKIQFDELPDWAQKTIQETSKEDRTVQQVKGEQVLQIMQGIAYFDGKKVVTKTFANHPTKENRIFDLEERQRKLQQGTFDQQDLSDIACLMAKPNSPVLVLQEHKWTKVGKFWILIQKIQANVDDSFAKLVVVQDAWFIGKVKRIIYQMFKEGTWVMWGNRIPNTNLILDIWYLGDDDGRCALVVEAK